jgi:hypothetical protein
MREFQHLFALKAPYTSLRRSFQNMFSSTLFEPVGAPTEALLNMSDWLPTNRTSLMQVDFLSPNSRCPTYIT